MTLKIEVFWFDDKKLSLRTDVIGRNFPKKKNYEYTKIYISIIYNKEKYSDIPLTLCSDHYTPLNF